MVLVMEVAALSWGIWMVFRKSEERWEKWIGVAMIAGALLVRAVFYWYAHHNPYHY